MRVSIERVCKKHGLTKFNQRKGNTYRCQKCEVEDIAKRRTKVKTILVNRMGGKCSVCGYNKSLNALEFHHTSPAEKSFSLGNKMTWNPERLWEEVKKCILVCANCHREIEEKLHELGKS